MAGMDRRDFLRVGALSLAGLAGCKGNGDDGDGGGGNGGGEDQLDGKVWIQGGKDFSPKTGVERKAIPSACWQCVTRDGIIGYVEDGRLVKIEGHPGLPRTNGKVCARGQAGVNTVYSPDRVLYPLVRTGPRGAGQWKKISWDEALGLVVNGGTIAGRQVKGIKTLRDEGHPELFMFHYGRMKGSDGTIIKDQFLAAYGTKTIGNHTSICESARWTAQELTWGSHYDNWDLENTKLVLNFGANVLEAHTNHIPMAQRLLKAIANGVKVYTFDVRLTNTAARSTEWIPVKPGTDLAVILAMANVLLGDGICDTDFIETYTNVKVDELKDHLKEYTPEWAEKLSGVPAAKIRSIALEYGRTRPSVAISYRGLSQHWNGIIGERALLMLDAIAGNIDAKGGRCRAVGAKWKPPFEAPTTAAKGLPIDHGFHGAHAFPTHHVSNQIYPVIAEGSEGRPYVYMTYCHNPVYVNGDCRMSSELLKDETKIPFMISVDIALSETSELADLILPDATYLERWTCDDMVSATQIQEYYIRQPMHAPLGEARNFCDVVCDLAKMCGCELPFHSAEEFVRATCENTPGVKEAGGFEHMKANGAWYDEKASPAYLSHAKEVDVSKAVLDEATGVYWDKHEGDKDFSSLDAKNAAKQYIAQKCGDGKARKGFPPDKGVWKTGFLEIKSKNLADKGFPALPSWMPIPDHASMSADQLVLTTFKVRTQTQSRTQNCKYLTELYHDNPAWIHPATASQRGIKDGDAIRVRSKIGEITIKAHVTEGIVPGVVAISNHCGHWAWGEFASGKKMFTHACEPDCANKWWKETGVHPNWIIPPVGDPIGGTMCWMDTVVTATKA
ncbi:MAG: molybdopterin-dependent oxidoreductase [Planctomycetes bacterium]|nr:molybdopterin-dependent oxidoreductase [Planctomycetota bacterium]